MSEHTVQRLRHPVEVERIDERCCKSDLPVGEEATKLFLSAPRSMRGLLLVCPERAELAVRSEDFFNHLGAETTNQLVLEICLAHIEAQTLQVCTAEVVTEAGPLESKPEVALFSRVT